MSKLNSKKVLAEISRWRTRLRKMKPGSKDLVLIKEALLDLFEIIYSKKSEYREIENYVQLGQVRAHLPIKRGLDETGPVKYKIIPSDDELENINKKFIDKALDLLERAKKKYSLKVKLEE